jgi:glycosyltransferase involved in cell wall biosynthesis
VNSSNPAATTVQLDDIIYSLQAFGGISTYWRQLTEALGARGDVRLLRTSGGRGGQFARVRSEAPVFHSSYFRVPSSRRTRCVVTVHDLAFEKRICRTATAPVSRLLRERALRRADAIICVSEYTRQELVESYPFLRSHPFTRVIYHGCGCVDDQQVGSRFDRPEGAAPFALFVGLRGGYKNFRLALEAFSQSRFSQEGLLVCTGPALTRQERAAAKALGVTDRLRVTSAPTAEQLRLLYSTAAMLLHTSRYEGFGLPVLEAMASGCPVIALDQPAVREVANGAARLIPNEDPLALAEAMDRAAEPEAREQLVASGYENASRFSWGLSAAAHAAVYQELGSA